MDRHVCDWSGLAAEPLVSIMELLPLKHRLRAGVCNSTWRAAVIAATSSLAISQAEAVHHLALQPWILQHGQHLTSIQLDLGPMDPGKQLLQLQPCSRLRELAIEGGRFVPPLLPYAAATSLTKLVLHGSVPADDSLNTLASAQQYILGELLSFTRLQSLSLHLVLGQRCCVTSSQLWYTVQHLQQLTQLKVDAVGAVMRDCHGRISCLTNLRYLSLTEGIPQNPYAQAPAANQLEGMQHLQSLTGLMLDGGGYLQIHPSSVNSIGQLTGLRSLDLRHCGCDVAALAAITALQAITMVLDERPVPAAGLMAWLGKQQQLTSLCLCGDFCYKRATGQVDPDPQLASEAIPLAPFAAITASGALQALDLSEAVLPADAWHSFFVPGRTLAQLTSLHAPQLSTTDAGHQLVDTHAVLSKTAVCMLVQLCPALQALEGRFTMHLELQLSCLQGLTRLDIMRARDDASAGALMALTALQQLRLRSSSWRVNEVDSDSLDRDLVPLSSLSCLTGLELYRLGSAVRPTEVQASVLSQLTGLKSLLVRDFRLTEEQLSRLCGLTRLTELEFDGSQLGMLLLDRVRGLPRNQGTFYSWDVHVIGPEVQDGLPSKLSQQLKECFACNHQQVQQELADLRRQVAQLTAQRSKLAALVQAALQNRRAAWGARNQLLLLDNEAQALLQQLQNAAAPQQQEENLLYNVQQPQQQPQQQGGLAWMPPHAPAAPGHVVMPPLMPAAPGSEAVQLEPPDHQLLQQALLAAPGQQQVLPQLQELWQPNPWLAQQQQQQVLWAPAEADGLLLQLQQAAALLAPAGQLGLNLPPQQAPDPLGAVELGFGQQPQQDLAAWAPAGPPIIHLQQQQQEVQQAAAQPGRQAHHLGNQQW